MIIILIFIIIPFNNIERGKPRCFNLTNKKKHAIFNLGNRLKIGFNPFLVEVKSQRCNAGFAFIAKGK